MGIWILPVHPANECQVLFKALGTALNERALLFRASQREANSKRANT